MKLLSMLLISLSIVFAPLLAKKSAKKLTPISSFHDLKAKTIEGRTISMSKFKGKHILVVNTASKCRYTKQYADLEKLYQKYKDQLVILAFPSNNFLWQEPGSDEKIKNFCQVNYGVNFPIFSKICVKGKNQHPIYKYLTEASGRKVSWNFDKFLLDREGKLIKHFKASVEPLDQRITDLIK